MNPYALKYGLVRPMLERMGYQGPIPGTPEFAEARARGERPIEDHLLRQWDEALAENSARDGANGEVK